MIDSITRITLNLQETNTMVSIRAKRGDTGRKLLIHLSDGSIPYHISDDCYATFTAKKPDGTKINNACTIENNVIEYEFTEQTCTAAGTMKAEIRLYGADNKMITSACFLINVYDTVFRDGDEVDSESEMNTLDDLILRANAFLNETGKLLRWQGNWDSEAEYEANDLVLHEEVLYVAEDAIAAGTAPGSEEVTAWVPIAGMGTGSGGEVVGIASVKQTITTSTSGGLNVVTVTLTDGTESEIVIRNGQPGASIQGPQGPMGPQGIRGPMGPTGATGPQGPAGPAGGDYVLTPADKEEIAEMAADLVEVPEHSGGNVENGEDGFSPIAKVEQTATGAVISITDKNGTTTATITNGKDGTTGAKGDKGDKGDTGAAGPQGEKGAKGDTGAQGIQGIQGDPGAAGADGFSPTATVTQTAGGAVISITDKDGTTTATITNGKDGKNGADGAPGEKGDKGDTGAPGADGKDGANYVFTEADKEEIVDLVIASLGGQPVFGRVDSNHNIIITAALEDGVYTLKYEYEDGTFADIGTMTVGGENTSTVIAITWNNCYKCGYTVGQSYELVADNSYCTSDVIEVEAGTKYTLTINNNTTVTKFRVVGANSSGIVTEVPINNVDIAVGNNTYTFTLANGTTQIRLRTYVDAHLKADWVLTKE